MRFISLMFIFCIVVLGASFALINAETVTINYYVGKLPIPLSMLIISLLAIGVFIGFCMSLMSLLSLKLKNMRLAHEVQKLKKSSGVVK